MDGPGKASRGGRGLAGRRGDEKITWNEKIGGLGNERVRRDLGRGGLTTLEKKRHAHPAPGGKRGGGAEGTKPKL